MNIKEMAPLNYLDGQWGTIEMFGMPDADADCPGSTTSNYTRMSKFREPFVVWKGPKSMAGGKKLSKTESQMPRLTERQKR